MSAAENKALVENLFAARARGDHAPFRDAMADDLVWRIMGSSAWSRDYVGKDAVREQLLKPLYAQFVEPTRLTPERILADGDHVVVQCRGDAVTRDGPRYANAYCLVFRVADGKLRELTEYMDTALVDRVLRPPPGQ